jgi:hypothetical protein
MFALPLTVTLLVHLTGPSHGVSTSACFLRLPTHVAGGGTAVYCLQAFDGQPGPNATVRDRGVMTFTLPHGTITARVSIVERFAKDGKHAHQSLAGTVVGGTRAYLAARGTIAGGGTDVEAAPGRITSSSLRYTIRLTNKIVPA